MSADPIYIGDIVRLSDEYGGLIGTLDRLGLDKDSATGRYAVVKLSGDATIQAPPESLTYAGPKIPAEPELGTMVLIDGVPYHRKSDGWVQMGRATSSLDQVAEAFFPAPPMAWGKLIRHHGHVKPQRLMTVPLDSRSGASG